MKIKMLMLYTELSVVRKPRCIEQQCMRLFIAQDAETDRLYNYYDSRL